MKSLLSILVLITFLSGCTTAKTLQATGGSRSDGVVELSYQYGGFEEPEVDWEQGLMTATSRCSAWGFDSAEAFGGVTEECQSYNAYGCVRQHVTVKYQCIGDTN